MAKEGTKLKHGFKAQANRLVIEIRNELGLNEFQKLDPIELAHFLQIDILPISCLPTPAKEHFLHARPEVFSAATIFSGTSRLIIYNDIHSANRQNTDIAHELSHGLLGHTPTPALDNYGWRDWDNSIEAEATWLAGALLVPDKALIAAAVQKRQPSVMADEFGVSERMIEYRLNVTGAKMRAQRIHAFRERLIK